MAVVVAEVLLVERYKYRGQEEATYTVRIPAQQGGPAKGEPGEYVTERVTMTSEPCILGKVQ